MSDKDQGPSIARTQELLMLGEIKGLVQGLKDGQTLQNQRMDNFDLRFDSIDGRLRTVETKAAIAGALSGSAMAVGTALVIEGIKQWISNRSIGQ
nr:hypothetical protein [uncultured Albidiferax sp.]